MALLKKITQPDGVATDYHRILYVSNNPNSHVSIAVASYLSEEMRETERAAQDAGKPYCAAKTYETEDVDELTFSQAYTWLKENVDEFIGAEDV